MNITVTLLELNVVLFEIHEIYFSIPPTTLLPSARYEKITEMFGGKGFYVKTVEELKAALKESIARKNEVNIIHIAISPYAQRKPQVNFHLKSSVTFFPYTFDILSFIVLIKCNF